MTCVHKHKFDFECNVYFPKRKAKPAAASKRRRQMMKMEKEAVGEALKSFECVCIDVDSTACVDEGIDVLAEAAGCGEEVANW